MPLLLECRLRAPDGQITVVIARCHGGPDGGFVLEGSDVIIEFKAGIDLARESARKSLDRDSRDYTLRVMPWS